MMISDSLRDHPLPDRFTIEEINRCYYVMAWFRDDPEPVLWSGPARRRSVAQHAMELHILLNRSTRRYRSLIDQGRSFVYAFTHSHPEDLDAEVLRE